jgi:hypothetical protein
MLVWNEIDFLTYLEVEPVIGEYEIEYRYEVLQSPLRLLLSVFHLAGDIYISIFCDHLELAVIDFAIRDCPGARVVNDDRGNYIEFAAANCFTCRYDGESVIPYGVRLFVRPQIRVMLFGGAG